MIRIIERRCRYVKICTISMAPVAGFKSFLENIVSLMTRQGYEVTILYLSGQNKIPIKGTEERVYELSEHINEEYVDRSLTLRKNVRRVMFRLSSDRSSPYAVLKNNLFHSQTTAVYKAEACEPKLDLTEFDCVLSAEEVQCNYFLAYSVTAKKKIGYIHPDYSKTPYDKKCDRRALAKLDYVCATSKANAEAIKKALPSIKDKVIGIPNPINVAEIIQRSEEIGDVAFDNRMFNIITVCRLDNTYKALDRLLRIAERLKEAGDRFVWRIIGDGEYRTTMQTFISEHDLASYVIWMGARSNPIPYVRASDLFVLQSYSEGYPMSVCEALAVSTPVLVTNYPSASEQVVDGVTGYIVENNAEDIYAKLHAVINDADGMACIRKKLESYDKSRFENIDELLNLIR